ncbi:efflux RND transporter periplasmic adaptor subunit [Ottowia sp.]|jgi:RND family efflux transporter MFP subunit|uniref:efflux RND transporter periplasmic adaptor subunit n=1 Tax=Ottowia sp. TaxID=1898956 RepID=UPI0025F09064|nr:efflux RND transporter periplasmic adaptor subunit [Ottowia sp.]MBK6614895.1 efflux RND transporter periplasmic adaptor subunit [Ottowia sp.]MBK6745979.1 efflux RND transporter periplasmic adaptor subunit [Ottowia sp.]
MTAARSIPALATVLLLAACGARDGGAPAGAASGPQAAASAPRPALTVTAARPRRQSLPREIAANGDIAAWQEASVGTDAAGLRLADVRASVGDVVAKGQVLATFDPAPVQQDQAQARASLAEAEAALAEAAGNAARARAVEGRGALSQQQIQQYLTAEKTARARAEAARAVLASQAIRVRNTQVLAPDAGVISARTATVGQVVQQGAELFRLVRRGRLEWRAEVMAEQLTLIQPGQPVAVELPGPPDAPAPQVAGAVRQVAPTVDARTRYALVYVDLPAGSLARAGMFARGRVQLGQDEALTVPQEAVVMRDGFAHVLALHDGDRVRLTRVDTGRLAGERIEVTRGLDANARVAVRGAAFLNDGDVVRVVEDSEQNKPPASADSAPSATK